MQGKTVLLLASGSSIKNAENAIRELCCENTVISFSANFVWERFECDFAFSVILSDGIFMETEIHIRIKLLHLIYSQREWLQSML